jgi:phosphoribosylformylglycinamidine cyclo-ligase
VLDASSWTMPPLFQWLQQHGGVADAEMHRVFNCGIGMTVIVSKENADAAFAQLEAAGETVYRIGEIRARADGEAQTIVV